MSERVPESLWPDPEALGPLTDLYQLTMMAGYHAAGLENARATFELFVRRLPKGRSYLVFAGLEQAVADLARLRFTREQVDVIRAWPVMAGVDPGWLDALPGFRFRGDVWAAPEGSIVFAGEPIVRVEASLPEAQWIETFLIASLAYPTLVASKAARIVEAARGRVLLDFGTRRGHGPLAGLLTARAAFLAGFDGTSNVEAAIRLGIPASGTMAHSWVQAFEDEPHAFAAFARVFPGATLLVDTYDVPRGVRHAAAIEPAVGAIRLDSGDLLAESIQARQILDDAGRRSVKIVASGDLDEWEIDRLVCEGAPIDGFGVGTELVTSRDAPALSMVYKLVELDGQGRIKLSPGKRTYPCGKQVRRQFGPDGRFLRDVVTRADEPAEGMPLLVPVVRGGQPVTPWPSLYEVREHCRGQRAALPEGLRGVDATGVYPLEYSALLEAEADRLGVGARPHLELYSRAARGYHPAANGREGAEPGLFGFARRRPDLARIISVANQKGGVGKTTTAINIAAGLAKAGKTALVIDVDPQCNATSGLGVEPAARHPLVAGRPLVESVVETTQPRLSVLPGSQSLADADALSASNRQRASSLRQQLASELSHYDYVFLDCPPSLGQLTRAALGAANEVYIPIQCEYFAMEGLSQIIELARQTKAKDNHRLEIGGIVLTMYDPALELANEVATEVRGFFDSTVFRTPIPRDVHISEAPSHGVSVLDYSPRARGAWAYAELVMEVIDRE